MEGLFHSGPDRRLSSLLIRDNAPRVICTGFGDFYAGYPGFGAPLIVPPKLVFGGFIWMWKLFLWTQKLFCQVLKGHFTRGLGPWTWGPRVRCPGPPRSMSLTPCKMPLNLPQKKVSHLGKKFSKEVKRGGRFADWPHSFRRSLFYVIVFLTLTILGNAKHKYVKIETAGKQTQRWVIYGNFLVF